MSFGSIFMLAWGLVVAVPVILHLLRKRKSRTVSWGAMRFLQVAMVRRAKRFQLWRLLLLMLRIAAIIMLVFAVARPLLDDESDGAGAREGQLQTLHVLAFDASYSMRASAMGGFGGAAGSERTRFEIAQQAASEVLRRSDSGDGFLLAKLGSATEWIGNGISYRADEMSSVVEQLQPSEGLADLSSGLLSVERVLDDVEQQGWNGPINVYLFSDLQPISWEGLRLEEVQRRLAGAKSRPESGNSQSETELVVIDCRQESGLKNVWADDLTVRRGGSGEGGVGTGATIAFRAGQSLARLDDQSEKSLALAQLIVNGRVEQSQRVELDEASRVLNWSHRLVPGRHVIEVRLAADDAIELDNRVRQVVTRRAEVAVALFSETSEAARYLELAISAGANVSGAEPGTPFIVQRYQLSELANIELGRELLWVLCDPVPLDVRSQQRLKQHVQQGGGVVWWLGPSWQNGAGGLEFEDTNEAQWSAASVVAVRGDDDVLKVDPLGYEDSIIRPFEPYPGAGLLTLPIFKYWDLKLGRAWKETLGVSGVGAAGSDYKTGPLIGKLERLGGGRELIVATPPYPGIANPGIAVGDSDAEPWNALIAWPAFVPLVQEILQWTGAGQEVPGSFIVGEPIVGSSLEAEMGTRVVGSSGEALDVEVTGRFGSRVRWTAGVSKRVDVYRWADGPSQGEAVFAVNVDVREGNLAGEVSLAQSLRVVRGSDVAQVLERRGSFDVAGGDGVVESFEGQAGARRENLKETGNEDVGWWLLLVAVGFLFSEAALARMLETRF